MAAIKHNRHRKENLNKEKEMKKERNKNQGRKEPASCWLYLSAFTCTRAPPAADILNSANNRSLFSFSFLFLFLFFLNRHQFVETVSSVSATSETSHLHLIDWLMWIEREEDGENRFRVTEMALIRSANLEPISIDWFHLPWICRCFGHLLGDFFSQMMCYYYHFFLTSFSLQIKWEELRCNSPLSDINYPVT